MEELIKSIRKEGDTIGGIITCVIKNVPIGLGEPVFDKLHAQLGKAMLSINAVKGFEYGSGFDSSKFKGSEHNDVIKKDGTTATNYSGGVQGGISNGMDIYFNIAFKPVATVMKKQNTINKDGEEVILEAKGRHDPCVLPRAVPIVESMAALVIADYLLIKRANKKKLNEKFTVTLENYNWYVSGHILWSRVKLFSKWQNLYQQLHKTFWNNFYQPFKINRYTSDSSLSHQRSFRFERYI